MKLQATLLLAALLVGGIASAQTMYKYRGPDGEWIYSDRPPDDGQETETRSVSPRARKGQLTIESSFTGSAIRFVARNQFYAPMEVGLVIDALDGVAYPPPDHDRIWVVPARSELQLFDLPTVAATVPPSVDFRSVYLPGDPDAAANTAATYRVPFSVGTSFQVTQSYPDSITHLTRDSMHAIDIAMPVGTDIVAARDGIVFDVSSANFKGGPNADEYADLANLVRILHDDGTFAVYAHLNWNTIRVSPGERVQAGQYIADSGNTGYSTGPHLHFAVQRNLGMRVESLPVTFRGPGGAGVRPQRGALLTAYQ